MCPESRFERPVRSRRPVVLLGMLFLALSATACIPLARAAVGSYMLSDPVPALLNGPKVTTDPNLLAQGGRAVKGVAADGVSEMVIAVSAGSVGQQFTFQVYNDQGQASSSVPQDGGLGAPGATYTQFGQGQITVAAVATSTAGPMAFAVYRAPLDFARPGGADDSLAQRSVSVHWSISGSSTSGTIPVVVLRPPLMLVHGLWGSPADWNDFQPLATDNPKINDARFAVARADYDVDVDNIASSTPSWSWYDGLSIKANALGYVYNAQKVIDQISSFVNTFKRGDNPASIPVAAVEVDVVAHSMGGDVTRTMPLVSGFGSDATFGQGSVHKLITVDTPHLGSPLATGLLTSKNTCLRDAFNAAGMYSFTSVTTDSGQKIDGAIGDLSGNGTGGGLSPALQALQPSSNVPLQIPHLIPTAYLVGAMGLTQLDGLNNPGFFVEGLRYWCSNDPLAQNLTVLDWPGVMGGASDAIVPLSSEDNESSPYSKVTSIHSAGTEYLGFKGPGALQSVTGNPQNAIDLLNTWITSSTFTGLR